jgi:hypothetical protein
LSGEIPYRTFTELGNWIAKGLEGPGIGPHHKTFTMIGEVPPPAGVASDGSMCGPGRRTQTLTGLESWRPGDFPVNEGEAGDKVISSSPLSGFGVDAAPQPSESAAMTSIVLDVTTLDAALQIVPVCATGDLELGVADGDRVHGVTRATSERA